METSNGPSCLLQLIISSPYHYLSQIHIIYHCISCSQLRVMSSVTMSPTWAALHSRKGWSSWHTAVTFSLSALWSFHNSLNIVRSMHIRKKVFFSTLLVFLSLDVIQHLDLVSSWLVSSFPPVLFSTISFQLLQFYHRAILLLICFLHKYKD